MSTFARAALLLGVCLLAGSGFGCGNGESTDPSKLPPLTESDMEEIRQRDAQIEDEEQGTPYIAPGKAAKVRGRRTAG